MARPTLCVPRTCSLSRAGQLGIADRSHADLAPEVRRERRTAERGGHRTSCRDEHDGRGRGQSSVEIVPGADPGGRRAWRRPPDTQAQLYADSPCEAMSRPSRSASSGTRSPIVYLISVKATSATTPETTTVVSTPCAWIHTWPALE